MSYANSNFRQSRPQATNLRSPELRPPNRLTLLRIQYYEFKVKVGSQFRRIKDKFRSVPCPILAKTRKKSQPENAPSEIKKNGRGVRNTSESYYDSARRRARETRLTWDADDEESDFEPGEFCTSSELKFRSSNYTKRTHTERKLIRRRRSSMACKRNGSQSPVPEPEVDHFITTIHRGFGDVPSKCVQSEDKDKVCVYCEDKSVQAEAPKPKKLRKESIKKLRKVFNLRKWRKKKDRETKSPEDAKTEKDDADIHSVRNKTKSSMEEETLHKPIIADPAMLPFTAPVPWNTEPLHLPRNGEPEKTFWQHVKSFAFRKRSEELPPPRFLRFKFAGGEKRKDFEESNIPFLNKFRGKFNDSEAKVNQDGSSTGLERLNGPFSNAIPPSPLNSSTPNALNALDNLCSTLQKICGHEVGVPIPVNSPPVENSGGLGALSSLGSESQRYLSNFPLLTSLIAPSFEDPFTYTEAQGYVPQTNFTSKFTTLLKPQNYQPPTK